MRCSTCHFSATFSSMSVSSLSSLSLSSYPSTFRETYVSTELLECFSWRTKWSRFKCIKIYTKRQWCCILLHCSCPVLFLNGLKVIYENDFKNRTFTLIVGSCYLSSVYCCPFHFQLGMQPNLATQLLETWILGKHCSYKPVSLSSTCKYETAYLQGLMKLMTSMVQYKTRQ